MADAERYADVVRDFLKLAKLSRVRPDANGLGRLLESFRRLPFWAMMRHLCISRQTDAGQLYFRDGVMRISRRDAHDQESALARMEARIAREFGIAPDVVAAAAARVREGRERCSAKRSPGS